MSVSATPSVRAITWTGQGTAAVSKGASLRGRLLTFVLADGDLTEADLIAAYGGQAWPNH